VIYVPNIAKAYVLGMPMGYATPIAITEISGKNLTNYAVGIPLTSTWDGWSIVKPNGSDIYFLDENLNPLYFWIENFDYTNNKALVWVRIPFLPANSTVKIYLVYGAGNPYITFNNPKNVFLFFDDFIKFDTSVWNIYTGTVSIEDGVLKTDPADVGRTYIYEMLYTFLDLTVEVKWKWIYYTTAKYRGGFSLGARLQPSGETYLAATGAHGYAFQIGYDDDWDRTRWTALTRAGSHTELVEDLWYRVIFKLSGSSLYAELRRYSDNSLIYSLTVSNTRISTAGGITLGGWQYEYVDWIIVRPYAHPEPSILIGSSIKLLRDFDTL